MKTKIASCLIFSVLCISGAVASERIPAAVSPAGDTGVVIVSQSCPTFSWTGVEWAAGYKVDIFKANSYGVLSHSEMEAMQNPVLSKKIRGSALSWTPSSENALLNGNVYVWYVQAWDAYGTQNWSNGAVFKVDIADRFAGVVDKAADLLRKCGVDERIIAEVLKDVVIGKESADTSAGEPQNGGYNTTERLGIQGNESGSNTYYGDLSGKGLEVNALNNSFFGYATGHNTETGDDNTFIGYNAGYHNTAGNDNSFLGSHAGYHNGNAYFNTCVGYHAGYSNQTGWYNTCIGAHAGSSINGGQRNVFLGYAAGANETGSNKLYVDISNTNSPLIYGEFDNDIIAINGKLGLGTKSPQADLELQTSGRNTMFLLDRTDGAKAGMACYSNQAVIGTATNHPLLLAVNYAWKMRLNSNNSLHMANGAECTSGGVWKDASSREYKENIQGLSLEEACRALSELNPVKYNYKNDKEENYVGFIAEDVPEIVASKDRKSMSPMDVVAVLTKVVQEQQSTISELERRIYELEKISDCETE